MDEIKKLEGAVKKNPALGVAGAVGILLLLLYLKNRVNAANATLTATPAGTIAPAVSYASPTSGGYSYGDVQQTSTVVHAPAPTPIPIMPTPVIPTAPGTIPVPSAANPLIPFNFFKTHQFPTIPGNNRVNVKTFSYGGTTYNVQPGPYGKVYGTPTKGGKQVLLYAPISQYH